METSVEYLVISVEYMVSCVQYMVKGITVEAGKHLGMCD